MEKRFIRVRSIKDIIIPVSLVIAGIILSLIPTIEGMNLGGYLLITVGLILGFVLKGAYKDVQTKELYLKKELLFAGELKERILSAIATSPEKVPFSEEGKGQALKLEVYYSKRSGRAQLQLFSYVPHQYNPCSEVYHHDIKCVEKLLK